MHYGDYYSQNDNVRIVDGLITRMAYNMVELNVTYGEVSFEDFATKMKQKEYFYLSNSDMLLKYSDENKYRKEMHEIFSELVEVDMKELKSEIKKVPNCELTTFLSQRKIYYEKREVLDDELRDNYHQKLATEKVQTAALSLEKAKV